jgi:hypothetical protein
MVVQIQQSGPMEEEIKKAISSIGLLSNFRRISILPWAKLLGRQQFTRHRLMGTTTLSLLLLSSLFTLGCGGIRSNKQAPVAVSNDDLNREGHSGRIKP